MYGPHTTKPQTTKKTKTGSWRTEAKPKFLQKECIGCKMCVLICPEACVSGAEKKFDVDYTYCKGCGMCAVICPKKDIAMVKE